MKSSSLVVCIISIFSVVVTDRHSNVSETCAKYTEELCKCSDVDHQVEEIPLKMCSYKEGKNVFCKPCEEIAQDNATCAECLELACPACKMTSLGLIYEEKALPMVEDEYALRNDSREKRTSIAHKWCRIENELLNGRFMCKSWLHKKECILKCLPGDDYIKGFSYHFSCDRKTNFWIMETRPCENPGGGTMSNLAMPLGRLIVGPANYMRVFMPISPIEINRGHGDYYYYPHYDGPQADAGSSGKKMGSYHHWPEGAAHKRSYTDLKMSSSADFEYEDEEVISATRIMPLDYLYEFKELDLESYSMLSNESSISYAPYKLNETSKEELSNLL